MKKQFGKKILRIALLLFIGIAMGYGFGYLAGEVLTDGSPDKFLPGLLISIVLLVLCGWAQIILHEGGHLIFGLATGYRFSSFRIGRLMLLKQDGKFCWKRYQLAGTGGQCLLVPPPLKNGVMPVKLYMLGGVIMNLATGTLALLLAALPGVSGYPAVALIFLGAFGLVMGLMNGIPMNAQVPNDGMNVYILSRNPASVQALWMQLSVNDAISRGVRLRDMQEDWFEASDNPDNMLTSSVCVFQANRLMDSGDFETAKARMESLLHSGAAVPDVYRAMMHLDLIFIELLGENRPEEVERLMDNNTRAIMRAMRTNPSIIRTRYALALLRDHNAGEGRKALADFERAARRHPYPVEIEAERELLEQARKAAEKAKN